MEGWKWEGETVPTVTRNGTKRKFHSFPPRTPRSCQLSCVGNFFSFPFCLTFRSENNVYAGKKVLQPAALREVAVRTNAYANRIFDSLAADAAVLVLVEDRLLTWSKSGGWVIRSSLFGVGRDETRRGPAISAESCCEQARQLRMLLGWKHVSCNVVQEFAWSELLAFGF
jgi:hypothetical protein